WLWRCRNRSGRWVPTTGTFVPRRRPRSGIGWQRSIATLKALRQVAGPVGAEILDEGMGVEDVVTGDGAGLGKTLAVPGGHVGDGTGGRLFLGPLPGRRLLVLDADDGHPGRLLAGRTTHPH